MSSDCITIVCNVPQNTFESRAVEDDVLVQDRVACQVKTERPHKAQHSCDDDQTRNDTIPGTYRHQVNAVSVRNKQIPETLPSTYTVHL